MTKSNDKIEEIFEKVLNDFRFIKAQEIPDIDLYMDQVTTFMDQKLSSSSRDPENDKLLTKTMINNYAKNDLLIPPVRKKYNREHIILLLFIYYMKNFLSINDIREILKPVIEGFRAGSEGSVSLEDIYDEINSHITEDFTDINEQFDTLYGKVKESFCDIPEEEAASLQRFDLVCRLSADIYIKKLFIERMIDEEVKERTQEEKNRIAREKENRKHR